MSSEAKGQTRLSHESASPASTTPKRLGTVEDVDNLAALGYQPGLMRSRSMYTLLFQSLAITAVPFGEGTAFTSAIYGGGPLAYFVGWIVVTLLDICVAISLGELASRFPTSAGPYYWSFQLVQSERARTLLSFMTGWCWLIGNWTITLSVNFGFANLITGTAIMYHPDWVPKDWHVLLIFYAICLATFAVCYWGNRLLPYIDTVAAVWNAITIFAVLIGLSVTAKAGRRSAEYALGEYNKSFAGWGDFTFFIGLLPAAYTFAAFGMISSMAEECSDPAVQLPTAMSFCVPIAGVAGLFFILPINFTIPPLEDILNASTAQALPYVFHTVTGSPGGGLALMFFVLGVSVFCSISITTAASRCTWAFARDHAIPFSSVWSGLIQQVPVASLALLTLIQMLLGLIYLGNANAFTAFASAGVIGLAAGYAIPIAISLFTGRKAVSTARWRCPNWLGYIMNALSVAWIAFQLVLFSMPTALPVTASMMNYSSVVLVGFLFLSVIYYIVYARRVYEGPPASDGLHFAAPVSETPS